MQIGIRTPAPYSMPQTKNAGGPAAQAETQQATLLDEKGRQVMVIAPDSTLPGSGGGTTDVILQALTAAAIQSYEVLPTQAGSTVTIRNVSTVDMRVSLAGEVWATTSYVTIKAGFERGFNCSDASEYQIARDDGLAGAERAELIITA